MNETEAVELAILERVLKRAPVNLEDMLFLLPGYTWNHRYARIDEGGYMQTERLIQTLLEEIG